jgi:hypothetical protein
MRFRVRCYRTEDGACPVREFLEGQRRASPDSYAFLIAGINKLRDRKYHREPLSKALPGLGLWELRHVDSGARILYHFRPKQLIVLLLGLVKKGDKLPRGAIAQAQAYRDDYNERCTNDEESVDEQL